MLRLFSSMTATLAMTALSGAVSAQTLTSDATQTGSILVADAGTTTDATDSAATGAAAEYEITGDAKAGKRVFNKCKACHKLEAGKNGVGPSLAGIIGRKSAQIADFSYSDAMQAANVVWTPDVLKEFLHKPKDFVPGTKMTFAGLKKDKDFDNLLAYLAQEAK